MSRTLPNIIITGTPGVGKTSHCELLAERTGLKHLSVNQVVKDRECHEGWDDEYQSWIVDEDKVRSEVLIQFNFLSFSPMSSFFPQLYQIFHSFFSLSWCVLHAHHSHLQKGSGCNEQKKMGKKRKTEKQVSYVIVPLPF